MKRFCILAIAVISTLSLWGQKNWQQQANYTIRVSLNDTLHTLDGEVRIEYTNHSPDTLSFVWMHLWANAYKNDRTAFSEQRLLEGETDFYFSKANEKGYINKINVLMEGSLTTQEDHPKYIDVVKLLLPQPILPAQTVTFTTPFHVQLPKLISRGGYTNDFFAATQWYPKLAVYDPQGWHPMPYLSIGEFYNDFGNYDVSITLPANYKVAATGVLQNPEERNWLQSQSTHLHVPSANSSTLLKLVKKPQENFVPIPSANQVKTIRFVANQVTDFAWAADKRFLVRYDTLLLPNKTVTVWNFFLPEDAETWKNSLDFSKRALLFYSKQVGEYAYPEISVVANPTSQGAGMEYPMFTLLNTNLPDPFLLDNLIAHEIGHNWFQAVLATNERNHGWMDEGFNTYWERRYLETFYPQRFSNQKTRKIPTDPADLLLDYLGSVQQEVPIEVTPLEAKPYSYISSIYQKTARWLQSIETAIGQSAMDTLFKTYYHQFAFQHPEPAHFKAILKLVTPSLADSFMQQLSLPTLPRVSKKGLKPVFGFHGNSATPQHIMAFLPAFGFNQNDGLLLGAVIHNYSFPDSKIKYHFTPLFGVSSKQIAGYGGIKARLQPVHQKFTFIPSLGYANFSFERPLNAANGEHLVARFVKLVPSIKLQKKETSPLSTLHRSIELKTFFIWEDKFDYLPLPPPNDHVFETKPTGKQRKVLPQLTLEWQQKRILYPWQLEWKTQQVGNLVRTAVTGNYFLNYASNHRGISARMFVGKIMYLKSKTTQVRSDNYRYHFTLQGPNGFQDYTYENAFVERNQSPSLAGRQIMMRDGGFKYRSDYSSITPGLSNNEADFFDNWMWTANFQLDVPERLNPLPFLNWRIFADLGTSASPWRTGSSQPKFLYSAGISLQAFSALQVYVPLLQSNAFVEPNKLNNPNRPGGANFWEQRLTFSLNFSNLAKKTGPIFLEW